VFKRRGRGVLDAPLEPVIGLAEGETRWRSMTERRESMFPRHEMPELFKQNHPQRDQRAQGMPGVRCTRGRVCVKKHTR